MSAKVAIIPAPVRIEQSSAAFTVTATTAVLISAEGAEPQWIAGHLAGMLRRATGFPIPVVTGPPAEQHTRAGSVVLDLAGDVLGAGNEGYELDVTGETITLAAAQPAGLFNGVQTLRQLMPPASDGAAPRKGPVSIPGGRIEDHPRFAWRGAMLDVSRHFFGVADIKRYVDDIALYKMNVLHLHLSDDQGWRIAIAKWPRLTEVGGSTQVGAGPGGFYTKHDYAEIVRYAAQRYITIVPEIDMPGHTNAALSSYPELNCSGKAPKPYRGTAVGFSSLCVDAGADATWRFVDDVIGELAAMTPGAYIHIGGDEVQKLSRAQYAAFIARVEKIVANHGKQMIGWEEIANAPIAATTLVQYWTGAGDRVVGKAAVRGSRVVMSPASKAYLDMKYNRRTKLGLNWAGYVDVKDAYNWDPAKLVKGVSADNVEGVEAPLWTETMDTIEDVEFMAFPRVAAIAEIGWSPAEGRDWKDFRARLAAHGRRWDVMGLRYNRSSQIDWGK